MKTTVLELFNHRYNESDKFSKADMIDFALAYATQAKGGSGEVEQLERKVAGLEIMNNYRKRVMQRWIKEYGITPNAACLDSTPPVTPQSDQKCQCGNESTGNTTVCCCNTCGLPIPTETWSFNLPVTPQDDDKGFFLQAGDTIYRNGQQIHVEFVGQRLTVAEEKELDEIKEKYLSTPSTHSEVGYADIAGMLQRDNVKLKDAGYKLAEAASYVVNNYDGVHRLSLAISEWYSSIGNQGDRDQLTPTKPVVDWKQLREDYFEECCEIKPSCYVPPPMDVPTSMKRVALAPHDLFEWFKRKLYAKPVETEEEHYQALKDCCNNLIEAVDDGKVPKRQIAGLRILLNK